LVFENIEGRCKAEVGEGQEGKENNDKRGNQENRAKNFRSITHSAMLALRNLLSCNPPVSRRIREERAF